jgi:uncharacterized protein GlcG (DUF336 family)
MAKQLTLEAAERVIEAGKKKAEEIGVAMCIAVHDGGANPVAFGRMDGALLAASDIAHKRAETTVGFQMATRDLTQMVQPGAPLFGIESAGGGRVVVFGGGVPLTDEDGRVVGGSASAAAARRRTTTWPRPAPRPSDRGPAAWALRSSPGTSPCSATPTRATAATGCRSWWAAATPTSATCSATA